MFRFTHRKEGGEGEGEGGQTLFIMGRVALHTTTEPSRVP